MNCQYTRTRIESYFDRVLSSGEAAQVESHLAECIGCRELLERHKTFVLSLSRMPLRAPRADYLKRAFTKARRVHEGYKSGFRHGALATLAASIVLMLVWLGSPKQLNQPGPYTLLQLGMHEERMVQLIFDSHVDIDNATIDLQLPENITLVNIPEVDIPGERTVSWSVDIKRGKNRLLLPFKARGFGGGQVIAELRQNNEKKIFVINLKVSDPKFILQMQPARPFVI